MEQREQARASCTTLKSFIEMFNFKFLSSKTILSGDCIMLDMSAALSVVDHVILLDKLTLYGFDETALCWIRSYLTNRYQRVYIEGCLSDPLPLDCGVPQGSILGLLLYIIYTNDLAEAVHDYPPSQEHPKGHHLHKGEHRGC